MFKLVQLSAGLALGEFVHVDMSVPRRDYELIRVGVRREEHSRDRIGWRLWDGVLAYTIAVSMAVLTLPLPSHSELTGRHDAAVRLCSRSVKGAPRWAKGRC